MLSFSFLFSHIKWGLCLIFFFFPFLFLLFSEYIQYDWLLTVWPCSPLSLDSICILLHTTETTDYEKVCFPKPSSLFFFFKPPAISTAQQLCRTHVGLLEANNNLSSFIYWLSLHTDKCHSFTSSSSCLNLCTRSVGLRKGGGGLQTYILHPSPKDDLMGLEAAITVLAGVNKNSMQPLEKTSSFSVLTSFFVCPQYLNTREPTIINLPLWFFFFFLNPVRNIFSSSVVLHHK